MPDAMIADGERLKVVFINRYFHPDHSATSQLLTDLACRLAAAGFRVEVITSRQLYDASILHNALPSRDGVRGVEVFRCGASNFGRKGLAGRAMDYLSFYILACIRAISVLRSGDIVVVMTDPPLLGVVMAPIAKFRRAKLVNWYQDLFPEVAEALRTGVKPGALASGLRWLRDWSCRAAASNVVISKSMAQYLGDRTTHSERITVIPNWAPAGLAPVDGNGNSLRDRWGLRDYFVVGYSGNLGRAHDWRTLLEAAESLRHSAAIRFLLVGGGAGMDLLRREVRVLGLQNILFQPYQPRELLSESLSAIDLHLISLASGLSHFMVPSKVYGIAAVGRPAVYIGGAEDDIAVLLRQERFGSVVDVGDAGALVQEIQAYADNASNYRVYCDRAQDAASRFSVETACTSWAHLISSMSDGAATSPKVVGRSEAGRRP